jgi:hypothetical protein
MGSGATVVRGEATHPANPIKEIAAMTYERLYLDDLIVPILALRIVRVVGLSHAYAASHRPSREVQAK